MAPIHFHATVAEVLARLPGPSGQRWTTAFERGQIAIELYAPRGADPQQPHTRNELYVVVEGQGTFCCGAARHPVAPGDVLFVPPLAAHRFEAFTDDFAAWGIIFPGGE